jgi:hypothetical protein
MPRTRRVCHGDAPVDDEFISLMKQNRALYCPTLFVALRYQFALSNTWRATEAKTRLADPEILKSMSDLDRIPQDLSGHHRCGKARRFGDP